MSYNNFYEACNKVEKPAHDKIYDRVYAKLIAQGWKYEEVHDKERQMKGMDVILSKLDTVIYIDEKARETEINGDGKDYYKTFGLELDLNGSGGDERDAGWFLKDNVYTTHYLMYYKVSYGDSIYKKSDEYVMLVDAKKLKEKIFSIPGLDRDSLLHPEKTIGGDAILNSIVGSNIKDGRIFYDEKRREHGRFLLLPLSFYHSLEGNIVYKIED